MTFAARAGWAPINRDVNGVPQVFMLAAAFEPAKPATTSSSSSTDPTRAVPISIWPMPPTTRAGSAMRIRSGVSRLLACGDRSLCRANTRDSMSICRAEPSFAITGSAGTPSRPNPFVGVPDPDYTGWYVEGSWFFGGHKNYDDEGRWGRPTVNNPMFHGSGGWGGCAARGKVRRPRHERYRATTYSSTRQTDAHPLS